VVSEIYSRIGLPASFIKISLDFTKIYLYIVTMLINKAYNFRLYPSNKQIELLAQHFGSCRFVYNYFLRKRIDFYAENKGKDKQGLTYYDTAIMLTKLKRQPEYIWLNGVNSQSLQQSLRRLDVAYNNFFNKRADFPNFKKKHNKQSFLVPQKFNIDFKGRLLHIPKFEPIKIVLYRKVEGIIKSINISKTPSGKYFASVFCEIEKTVKPKKKGNQIGIDLGLKSFLVASNGERVDAPKYLRKSEDKLIRLQRLLSRKVKGSNRRNKARIKVACIYDKISNQRKDFLHKLSHRLVSENQAIFAEDLYVKGMMTNHHLAKGISDSGWSEFVRQLEYKSEWNGVYFRQIDRFFPSSKRCFSCGWINEALTLKDREWVCQCGQIVDRDYNAAQNILLFGQRMVGKELAEPKRSGRGGAVMPLVELRSL